MTLIRTTVIAAMVLGGSVAAVTQTASGVLADLAPDVTTLESKVVGLAKAMPESAYGWRPGDGVRSVAEVFVHVAADNYFAAASLGGLTAAHTGISGKSYKEAESYESRKLDRAATIAALEESFALLKKALLGTPADRLDAMTDYFGPKRPVTIRRAWIGATVHLHEHLGQLIAYARTNKVVPPWSK
jgi:hypothetical protein